MLALLNLCARVNGFDAGTQALPLENHSEPVDPTSGTKMAKPAEPAAEGRAAQPETALTGAGLAAGDADAGAGAGDVAADAPPQPCRATRPNGTPSSSFRRADRTG
jgi:hypothetical protein